MKYTLEELFDLQMGKTPSRYNQEYWRTEDNKWIAIGDLSECSKYICETKEYLSDQAVVDSGISVIPPNTVVMSFKLSIGKTAITKEAMYSNEAIMSFRDRGITELIPDYIYYLFKAKDWNEGANKAVMGKTLNKATLSKVKIQVCDIEKQREIVDILDKVNNIIEARKEELEQLNYLIKSRFVEMFGDPVENPRKWSSYLCREISTKIGSGATPKGGKESYCEDGIALIRSMNVYNDKFEYKELAHITDEQAKKLNNVEVEEYDVLFNITGASVARCCMVPENVIPARVNQHVSIIRCKKGILPLFVCHMLINDNYQKKLLSIARNGGATREAITKQQIEELTFMIPPIELQKQFVDFVHQIDKLKVEVQKSLDEAQLLMDSLMQEYFG